MIRGATRADLDALLALEAQFPSDRLSRRSFHHLLTRAQARVLVYQDGDTLAGNAVVLYRRGQHAARLYSLVVHPTFQRRGIAGALLRAAEHDAQQRGCAALRLEVRADNSAAARLMPLLN